MSTNITQTREATRIIGTKPRKVIEQLDYYIYPFRVAQLAPNASATATVSIQADADFCARSISYQVALAGAPQTTSTAVIPLIRIQINDTGSSRNLFNSSVDLSVFGNPQEKYELPIERRFSANGAIQVQFENYSAATTYDNISLYLIGYKAWNMGFKS